MGVDAMDVSGESQIDVEATLFKQRLDLAGNLIDAELEKRLVVKWSCMAGKPFFDNFEAKTLALFGFQRGFQLYNVSRCSLC